MPVPTKGLRQSLHRHARTVIRHAKNHFIPYEGNNHHPHVLRHGALLVYSVLLVALKVVAIAAPIVLPSVSLYSSAITVRNIADLTNAARTNAGLPVLTLDDRLLLAAQAKAEDMVKNQYFAHQSPDKKMPWDFIRATGYDYAYAGENLAVHFAEAEDVRSGWIASPSHRANIVNTHYTETGIGIASGSFEGAPSIFVVQLFGQPLSTETATLATKNNTPPVPSVLQQTKIKPIPKGFKVTVQAPTAVTAFAQLGASNVPLVRVRGVEKRFSGTVSMDPLTANPSGELLSVRVTDRDNQTSSTPIALVAPGAKTQDVYLFNDRSEKQWKLLGFLTVHDVQDGVRKTYILFIILLSTALLLNVFIKIRIQHPSVIVHSLAVIGLTSVLLLF